MIRPADRFASVQLSMIRQLHALKKEGTINLGIGEPNLDPDERLRELMVEAAKKSGWGYTAIQGSLSLRETIAHRSPSEPDPEEEICVTAGSQEGLWAIFQAFIGRDDEVLVPDPGFVSYPALSRLAGGVPVPYPLDPDDWSLDLEAISSSMTDQTKMIVVNSPSNPTGHSIPAQQLEALCEITRERDVIVVSDEVYREIYYEELPASLSGRTRNVVTVTSVSKSHGLTGLRLGWIIADRELMTTIRKAHHYTTTCASTYAQTLVELILEDEEWNESWLERARAQFREQRAVAIEALEKGFGHPIEPAPDAAFYLFTPVPSCQTLQLAKDLATEHEVLVIPGVAFGSRGEGYLRISYAASPDVIREGIARLSRGLG